MNKTNEIRNVVKLKKRVVKVYRKNDVADELFPGLKPSSARSKMSRCINGDRKLREELNAVGFYRHRASKFYTESEYAVLLDNIGEPI